MFNKNVCKLNLITNALGLVVVDDIVIKHNKSISIINNVIINTSIECDIILDTDFKQEMRISDNDIQHEIVRIEKTSYNIPKKVLDSIAIGNMEFNNYKVNFYDIDDTKLRRGIIGLDFLKKNGAVIDFNKMEIIFTKMPK